MKKNLKKEGYTLIEVLAVVMLIGILSGLATTNITLVVDRQVRSSATQFATALRSLRHESLVDKGKEVAIWLGYDEEQSQYYYEVKQDETIEELHFFESNVVIQKKIEDEIWDIRDIVDSANPDRRGDGFQFDKGTGQSKGATGTYIFQNTDGTSQVALKVTKIGSVIIDDE